MDRKVHKTKKDKLEQWINASFNEKHVMPYIAWYSERHLIALFIKAPSLAVDLRISAVGVSYTSSLPGLSCPSLHSSVSL